MKTKLIIGLLVLFTTLVARAATTFTVTPAAISNTFAGNVSLFLTNGFASGQNLLMEKWLDANTNGVIDAADILIEMFPIRDGQLRVVGGATNLNRPRDLDGLTNGSVTTELSFLHQDTDHFIGKVLFRATTTNGTPLATNTFTVTNFPYSQMFTGLVKNAATLTNIPFASVALLQQTPSGNINLAAGTVANASGAFLIKAPAGNYTLLSVKSGYVADFATAPQLALGASQTIGTNLSLTTTTRTISGRVLVDGDTNRGAGGVQMQFQSTNNLFTIAWTDTNGNFSVPVTASQWKIDFNDQNLRVLGITGPQDQAKPKVDTTSGSVSNLVIALPSGASLFFGRVRDNLNNPVPDLGLYANTANGGGSNSATGLSDTNGSYSVLVPAEDWYVSLAGDELFDKGYVGTQGTNFSFGSNQAVQVDFKVIVATGTISGSVKDTNGNPVTDINVHATATIGGVDYQAQANTDDSGNYILRVANGTWSVAPDCGSLNNRGFGCATSSNLTVPPTNYVNINFTARPPQPLQITSTSPLPDGTVGNFYFQTLSASDGFPSYQWTNVSGSLPGGVSLDSGGNLFGTPTNAGTFCFTALVNDQQSGSAFSNFCITIQPACAVQVQTTSLPDGAVGCNYSNSLLATCGVPPYRWSLAFGSAPLPANLVLGTNGTVTGPPATNGSFSFVAVVTDSLGASNSGTINLFLNPAVQVSTTTLPDGTAGTFYSTFLSASGGAQPQFWSIAAGSLPPNITVNTNTGQLSGTTTNTGTFNFTARISDPCTFADQSLSITLYAPLQVTTATLPLGFVNAPYAAQLQATGGKPPYAWSTNSGSGPLPGGLNLNADGSITGTPGAPGTSAFIVKVTDANALTATRGLAITNGLRPTLDLPSPLASNQFQFRVTGAAGSSYTVQFATALTNWADLFTTNAASNIFFLTDPAATNPHRLYRLKVNP